MLPQEASSLTLMLSKERASPPANYLAPDGPLRVLAPCRSVVHDRSIRDMLTRTIFPRERCRHPGRNAVAAAPERRGPRLFALGHEGVEEQRALVTDDTPTGEADERPGG